jgi:hypothetical protein
MVSFKLAHYPTFANQYSTFLEPTSTKKRILCSNEERDEESSFRNGIFVHVGDSSGASRGGDFYA